MTTSTISIPVPDDLARAYEAASEQDRKKLALIVGLSLRDYLDRPPRPLEEIMDRMGEQAAERGLTEEALAAILSEPGDA